jgi:anaerobic ribonucleoside-triphosphate reductase activating protein
MSLKYLNTQIVFQEIPDEISLAINITNCPNNCKSCHSEYLKQDIGEELTNTLIDYYEQNILYSKKYEQNITL